MESNQTGIQKIVKKWDISSTFFIYLLFISYINY